MNVVIGIGTGLGVALGLVLHSFLQRRRNARLAAALEPVLRERGPMTAPALAEAVGMGGFYARGKVILALGQMTSQGRVETLPAPAGTPQLKKVQAIQYRLRA